MKLAFNGCNAPSFTSSEGYDLLYYSVLGISPSLGRKDGRRVQHHLLLQQPRRGQEGWYPSALGSSVAAPHLKLPTALHATQLRNKVSGP